jgi:uncharacterized protein YbjT (DUF2867 family)
MYLVAGATGSLGGKIVRELLARGEAVRALVRNPADRAPLEQAGAGTVLGDLRDPSSLPAACEGVAVVISTASASRREDDTPENVDARGNVSLIDAARAAGVGRFVLVSTIGASADSPVPVFRAKAVAEAHLGAGGIDYTILHSNAFMDVWFGMLIEMPIAGGMPVTLVGEARRRHSFIAERDVASFAVEAARHPAARNATIPIGGPEAVTFRQVAEEYERALGRPVPVRTVAQGEPIPGLPPIVWGIAAGLESFDSPMPMEETAGRFGVALTSVADFARERAAALGGAAGA